MSEILWFVSRATGVASIVMLTVVLVLVRFGMRDTFPAEMTALGFQVHEVRSEADASLFDQHRINVTA